METLSDNSSWSITVQKSGSVETLSDNSRSTQLYYVINEINKQWIFTKLYHTGVKILYRYFSDVFEKISLKSLNLADLRRHLERRA